MSTRDFSINSIVKLSKNGMLYVSKVSCSRGKLVLHASHNFEDNLDTSSFIILYHNWVNIGHYKKKKITSRYFKFFSIKIVFS